MAHLGRRPGQQHVTSGLCLTHSFFLEIRRKKTQNNLIMGGNSEQG